MDLEEDSGTTQTIRKWNGNRVTDTAAAKNMPTVQCHRDDCISCVFSNSIILQIFIAKHPRKNLFANFQLSEKNLISLLEGYIDHDKILRNFEINNQVVSLEILNLELKEIEENIDFFKSILETHIYSNNEN